MSEVRLFRVGDPVIIVPQGREAVVTSDEYDGMCFVQVPSAHHPQYISVRNLKLKEQRVEAKQERRKFRVGDKVVNRFIPNEQFIVTEDQVDNAVWVSIPDSAIKRRNLFTAEALILVDEEITIRVEDTKQPPCNKYLRTIVGVDGKSSCEVDVYSVLNAYKPSAAIGHAIKKLLAAGTRGAKDYETDLREAIQSIQRQLNQST